MMLARLIRGSDCVVWVMILWGESGIVIGFDLLWHSYFGELAGLGIVVYFFGLERVWINSPFKNSLTYPEVPALDDQLPMPSMIKLAQILICHAFKNEDLHCFGI